ncbi:MAG TPA: hypothetical protein PKA38_00085 [Candidatus Levybacteria bacterium]|nr:hypothetical protein [Candidatus Levybacteria bacterium]
MNKAILILPFVLGFVASRAYAAPMSNSDYFLNLEMSTTEEYIKPADKSLPAPEVPKANQITGDGYIIIFTPENEEIKPLSISSTNNSINFGEIIPGEPLTRTQSITVHPATNKGFQLMGYEDHSPSQGEFSIPDTSCDSGNCNNTLSESWENPLTYGFGYSCSNVETKTCDNGFSDNRYKSFSNDSALEEPKTILESDTSSVAKAVITYKLNIPGTQPQKAYRNTVYLIAVPKL